MPYIYICEKLFLLSRDDNKFNKKIVNQHVSTHVKKFATRKKKSSIRNKNQIKI